VVASADVERLILFRFDRDPLVCRNHITALRLLNPGVSVHGLYGGPLGLRGAAVRALGAPLLGLDSVFVSGHETTWNWKNGDLAMLDWFRHRGRRLRFDVLYLVEWDLLVLAPLAEAFAAVPPEAVGLTALTPRAKVLSDWRWTAGAVERQEFAALLRHVREKWPDAAPSGCVGCGPCYPRRFLERYAAADPPEWGNDEVRIPLYCDALGYRAVDTGFAPDRAALSTGRFFNVGGADVDQADVLAALQDPVGSRVFHPVRTRVPRLRQRLRSRAVASPLDPAV
jgi:hypothetical protein